MDPQSTDHRIVEGRDALPDRPPAGDYVVVDVTYYSTTVVELLAGGAESVGVPLAGDAPAVRAANPDALVGCEPSRFETDDRFAFPNSPSYVDGMDLAGERTVLVSDNRARTVADLAGYDDVAVFVGGYANAGAVAAHLADRTRPVRLVACGTDGDPTVDDHLGAVVVDRSLRGRPLDDAERDQFARLLVTSKGVGYADTDRRHADLHEYATAIDSRWVVPALDGDSLVATSRSVEETARTAAGE
jgi:2-phosphosulfolactate phosphatase